MTGAKLTQSHGHQCGVYSAPVPLRCDSTSRPMCAADGQRRAPRAAPGGGRVICRGRGGLILFHMQISQECANRAGLDARMGVFGGVD